LHSGVLENVVRVRMSAESFFPVRNGLLIMCSVIRLVNVALSSR
jgi:hypothetical protein